MANLHGVFKWVYDIGNWLAKIMYLHLLWVLFTVVGLGLFGITPATIALVSVIHKWVDQDFDIPIFKNFFTEYKRECFKSNGFGLILIALGVFFYVDIKISQQLIQSFYFHAFLLFISLLYIVTVLHFFTVYVRYDLKFFFYFRQSFLIAIARPFETIAMVISLIALSYLFSFLPVLIFFMGSSLVVYPLVWFGYRACYEVERKKEKLNEEKMENTEKNNDVSS